MIPRFTPPPDATPRERKLWDALRALIPHNSATVTWKFSDTGITAQATPPPPTTPRASPYRVHGVNGTQATVTGSFSASTPYLRINIANNTSEWSAVGGAWPPDTVILDGRMANCPEEYWVLR